MAAQYLNPGSPAANISPVSSGPKNTLILLIVKGLVQGVYFRAFTKETADRLGLSGWVRNLPDGFVEAVEQYLTRLGAFTPSKETPGS